MCLKSHIKTSEALFHTSSYAFCMDLQVCIVQHADTRLHVWWRSSIATSPVNPLLTCPTLMNKLLISDTSPLCRSYLCREVLIQRIEVHSKYKSSWRRILRRTAAIVPILLNPLSADLEQHSNSIFLRQRCSTMAKLWSRDWFSWEED